MSLFRQLMVANAMSGGGDQLAVPLTLTAASANSTVALTKTGSPTVSGLQYRMGTSGAWTPYTVGTTLNLNSVGDIVQFCNTENYLSTSNSNYAKFTMTGTIEASGNIMSMVNWRKDCPEYCFTFLFYKCTALTTAPILPATTLANSCYCRLFEGCTKLTSAPELPATTLANNCYTYMFQGCTGLTSAPELLPATTLADSCYCAMFNRCSALTQAPELPATTLTYMCYANMFSGCTGLTQAPELPATTLANQCYYAMFQSCTGLTSAPELPATTLEPYCYLHMFNGCTKLTTAPELPATTLAGNCYKNMFSNCSALSRIEVSFSSWETDTTYRWVRSVRASGTFVKPAALPETFGENNIPSGWTVVNK